MEKIKSPAELREKIKSLRSIVDSWAPKSYVGKVKVKEVKNADNDYELCTWAEYFRKMLENQTGKDYISPKKYKQMLYQNLCQGLTDIITALSKELQDESTS